MTRKEASFILANIDRRVCDDELSEALDMAIKTLEERKETVTEFADRCRECGREKVLDKIREEIADLDDANFDYEGYYKAVTDAVKIIDKYKAESEEV